MQIWAETGKLALPIRNYSQILYQFLTFTQNLKRSHWLLFYRYFVIKHLLLDHQTKRKHQTARLT